MLCFEESRKAKPKRFGLWNQSGFRLFSSVFALSIYCSYSNQCKLIVQTLSWHHICIHAMSGVSKGRIIFFQRGDPHLSLREAYCILDRQVASSSLWILRPTQRYVTGCHVCLGVANDRPGTRSLQAGAGRDANSQSGGRRWVVTWWWHSMEYLFFCRQPSDEACKMYLSLSLAGLPC